MSNHNLQDGIVTTETRQQRLIRLGSAQPRFLQGVYPFAGRSFFELAPLSDDLHYVVPSGAKAEVIYFRAGNLSDDIVYLALSVDQKPVRYFPVSAKGDLHVPLAIVEVYPQGTAIDICISAARGLTGSVVIDVGILEERES